MAKNDTNSPRQEGHLRRAVGFWPLVFFGVILMVPSGALVYYPITQTWSNGYSYLGYFLSTALIILTVMSYQRMISVFPEAGSAYAYTCGAINGKVGFMVGWVLLLDYILGPTLTLKLLAIYIQPIFPQIPIWVSIIVIGLFILLCCCLGIKTSVIIGVVLGAYIILYCLFFNGVALHEILQSGRPLFTSSVVYDSNIINWNGVLATSSLGVLLLAFDGMSTLAEESTVSAKKFGWAIMVAVIFQAIILISTAFLAAAGMDWTTIPQSSMETAYIYMLSEWTNPTFTTTILAIGNLGTIAALIGITTAACRVLFSMGRDGVLPRKFFGYLSPKFNTPTYSSILAVAVIIAGALILDLEIIASIVSFGVCLAFVSANISCFSYFWIKQKDHRVFRHLVFPLFASIGVLLVLANQSPICLIAGGLWLLAGLIYEIVMYKTSENFRECINKGKLEI